MRGFRRRKKITYKNEFVPNTTKCKHGCIHYRSLGGIGGGAKACHYYFDTGILRGPVPGNECEKFCSDKKQQLKNLLSKRSAWTSGMYPLDSNAYIKEVLK